MIEFLLTRASHVELSDPSKFNELSAYINQLIKDDFPHLIQLLYRLDVSEEKLKNILKEKPDEDAGKIIAELIIDRQIKRLKTRAMESDNPDADTEEKW